jgi:hypothetical protein
MHAAGSEGTAEHFQAATCPTAGDSYMDPGSNAISGFAFLRLASLSPKPNWGLQLCRLKLFRVFACRRWFCTTSVEVAALV